MHSTGVLGTSAWAGVYVTQVCFYTNVHICEHTRCRLCTYVCRDCELICEHTRCRLCTYVCRDRELSASDSVIAERSASDSKITERNKNNVSGLVITARSASD